MFLTELLGLYIALGIAGLLIIILIVALCYKNKASKKNTKKDEHQIIIENNVRYNAKTDEGADLKFNVGDILLTQGVVYKVSKNGPILPGKYLVLAASENIIKFNLRAQGFVREYHRNDEIVLAEDEEICAVSCNVILK